MTIQAKVLLDSISPAGARLTTFECTYPRFIHAEFMTHRMLSRNAASSRAIPTSKLMARIINDPARPVYWGLNRSGMQANEELPSDDEARRPVTTAQGEVVNLTPLEYARIRWLEARDAMIRITEELSDLERVHSDWKDLGLHKQVVNRLLEPWMNITIITSATNWANFWHLRTHKDAQPEFQVLACTMRKAYEASTPQPLAAGDWHMPLVFKEDYEAALNLVSSYTPAQLRKEHIASGLNLTPYDWARHFLRKVSVGRCARVSYLTHDGVRDLIKDIELHDRLLAGLDTNEPLHMSPFEHVARARADKMHSGNFIGFDQYRKMIYGESGPRET